MKRILAIAALVAFAMTACNKNSSSSQPTSSPTTEIYTVSGYLTRSGSPQQRVHPYMVTIDKKIFQATDNSGEHPRYQYLMAVSVWENEGDFRFGLSPAATYPILDSLSEGKGYGNFIIPQNPKVPNQVVGMEIRLEASGSKTEMVLFGERIHDQKD